MSIERIFTSSTLEEQGQDPLLVAWVSESVRVSDGVIRQETGRGWDDWFALLKSSPDLPASEDELRGVLVKRFEISERGAKDVAAAFRFSRLTGKRPERD